MITDYKKKQKKGRGNEKFYFIGGGIVLAISSALLIFADINVYKDKKKLDVQISEYKKQTEEIKKKNQALEQRIAESTNDDYIEKVAREELNLQKPGEKVVAFVAPGPLPEEEAPQQNFFNVKNWAGWISQIWKNIFE